MIIKIGKLPGRLREVTLPEGATVQDALNAAQIEMRSSSEVRVSGQPVSSASFASTALSEGAIVVVSDQVKGN